MDDPTLSADRHVAALRGLERINRLSGTAKAIAADLTSVPPTPRVVFDVGCGGGDVTIDVARRIRRRSPQTRVIGGDRSPRAVEYAQARARRAGVPVEFVVFDAATDPWPSGVEAIVSSLFLHHLPDDAIGPFLRRCVESEAGRVVMIDLERSPRGLALARWGTRALSRCDVVHHDGPQSVRAAFTVEELRDSAEANGLSGADVRRTWPARLLLTWWRR
ncbi:MAG: methyltransferase domain-containing protein [Phycisphaerae bacterium]|nr:methyltransferase domain-containing protein [Phycisphaerae bacterium]NNF44566.1 methyltransferase domain-containing protein [Phycisphaerales bacterium]